MCACGSHLCTTHTITAKEQSTTAVASADASSECNMLVDACTAAVHNCCRQHRDNAIVCVCSQSGGLRWRIMRGCWG